MPKLSFIVPVYKTEDFLGKCIDHLKVQALKDWEIIFVLDGPSKEARRVIKSKMKGVEQAHQVIEIEHGGACAARNAGHKAAKGDYLVFWDSDCYIEPGASKIWVDILDNNPHVGFVYSGYKFVGNKYSIEAEQWDPFLLRVRNFISTCFPVRKELCPGWNNSLDSLQDWDFWLSVLEKAEKEGWDITKIGKYLAGHAFSTEHPTKNSISGKGCTNEVWLQRVDAVRKAHNLPNREVCVASLGYKHEGVRLAKLIGADYQDHPTAKPHDYKTIIQVGFSLAPENVEHHARIFQGKGVKHILFWTGDDINTIYYNVSFHAIDLYAKLLNESCTQYVEDMEAKRMMERAGFKVEVMPMPIQNEAELKPMPDKPKWGVDISGHYSNCLGMVERSVPDMDVVILDGRTAVNELTGLIHFHPDRSLSGSVKRALLAGRHVISNIQQPFTGYVNDKGDYEDFIVEVVKKLRGTSGVNLKGSNYYQKSLSKDKLMGVL